MKLKNKSKQNGILVRALSLLPWFRENVSVSSYGRGRKGQWSERGGGRKKRPSGNEKEVVQKMSAAAPDTRTNRRLSMDYSDHKPRRSTLGPLSEAHFTGTLHIFLNPLCFFIGARSFTSVNRTAAAKGKIHFRARWSSVNLIARTMCRAYLNNEYQHVNLCHCTCSM